MPSATGLVTAVIDGHTLTSPTVYYSFDYLWTWGYNQFDFTESPKPLLTNQIVPMHSEDVSTVWQNPCDDYYYTYSMDWSNLNAPVPIEAYNQAYGCWDTPCSVVYGAYAPYLALPSKSVDLDPAWSTCTIITIGVFDPPHALQAATGAAAPVDTFTTTQTHLPVTSAAPASSPTASTVVPTNVVDPRPATTAGGSRPPLQPTNIGGSSGNDPSASSQRVPELGTKIGHNPDPDSAKDSHPSNEGATDPGKGESEDPSTGGSGSDHSFGSGDASGKSGNKHSDLSGNAAAGDGNGRNLAPPLEASNPSQDVKPESYADGQGEGRGEAILSIIHGGHGSDPGIGTDSGRSPGNVIASMFGAVSNADSLPSGHDEPDGQHAPGSSSAKADVNYDQYAAGTIAAASGAAITSYPAMPFASAGKKPIYVDLSDNGKVFIDGYTLTAGDTVTLVDGTRVSVATNGYVVIGTSTARIPTITP